MRRFDNIMIEIIHRRKNILNTKIKIFNDENFTKWNIDMECNVYRIAKR